MYTPKTGFCSGVFNRKAYHRHRSRYSGTHGGVGTKFNCEEEAMKFFAIFSSMRGKKKSTETTSTTPPQPKIPEDTTAQSPISHTEEPLVSIEAPAQGQPHAEAGQSASMEGRDMEEDSGRTDDGGLVDGMERMAVDEQRRTEKAAEGEPLFLVRRLKGKPLVEGISRGKSLFLVVSLIWGKPLCLMMLVRGKPLLVGAVRGKHRLSLMGGKHLFMVVWRGKPHLPRNPEGETPRNPKGNTPVEFAEGETPVCKNSEGETPTVFDDGETPKEFVEGKVPVNTEARELEGGRLTEVVDLVNEPEDDDWPIKRREARRMARKSLLDEVDELPQPRRLEFRAQGAGVYVEEDDPGSGDELEEAEERRLAAERKRKGKHVATIPPKRSRKTPSVERVEEPLPAATKVPYSKGLVGPSPESEPKDDKEEEELNYERTEVWVTKKMLEAMGQFDDPKRAQTYKERGASGKMAKSAKRYDLEALRVIGSEEEFLA